MKFSKLDDFMVKRGGSVDPSRFKNETFELLSIPAFDEGRPEIVEGEKIGSSKKVVQPRDVLLSKIVPHIRRCWVVPTRSEKRQIASGEWIQFRSEDIFPEYLRLFLISDRFHKQFMKTVKGVGGSLLRASPAQVAEIEIPIPDDFDDQSRIAHLLGKVEGLIAQRKQHLQQLDDLLKSVFLEMFGDPVRNEKGWDTTPFHQIGKFISGGTPSKSRNDFWNGSFPWVSPKDMKVAKINDSIDHISESVFEETNLKRITKNYLLIVVRGMILAHSFPVAINTVEIAINQDMKAIKPTKDVNVIYLQHCLTALKRRILKLISSAGHGTRKFDSIAMQKLLIPKPHKELQDQFANIVEKIEALKSRYQQSLTDLESLYGALSQQAFKGELDLSQVPLLAESEEQKIETSNDVKISMSLSDFFRAPDISTIDVKTTEGRKTFLTRMLSAWLEQFNHKPFSLTDFMGSVQNKLWDLTNGELHLNTDDYDQIKDCLFEALKTEKLEQAYDDNNNRIQLNPRSANGTLT